LIAEVLKIQNHLPQLQQAEIMVTRLEALTTMKVSNARLQE
jgi:hypothetical protein